MKSYKFTSEKYIEDLLNGWIWISPSHCFRISDGHEDGRSDPNELIEGSTSTTGEFNLSPEHPAYPHGKFIQVENGEKKEVSIIGMGDLMLQQSEALLFCASASFSPLIGERMAEIFEANACVEICDMEGFISGLHESIILRGKGYSHGKVEYVVRKINDIALSPRPSFFRKDEKFSWQDEYRICWDIECETDPFGLHVSSVAPFLKRLY